MQSDVPKTTQEVRNLVAAMWFEYNKDQACDYRRINRLIEEVSEIVAREIGGKDRLTRLGEAMEHLCVA
jgi:hypothetical protein